MDILTELYYGKIEPYKNKMLNIGTEEAAVYSYLKNTKDKLLDTLNNDQKQLLDRIEDAMREIQSYRNKESFAQGFKLGTRITTEVYKEKRETVDEDDIIDYIF